MSPPSLKLNTGAMFPAVGLGAFAGAEAKAAAAWILTAFKAGYRHIDTAYMYKTEWAAKRASSRGGLRDHKAAPHHPGRVQESIDQSLKAAGLDYFDLYLIHWPQVLNESMELASDAPSIGETWSEMEKIFASGKAKAIGVSNFSIKTLDELLVTAKVVPAVKQVELHPYLAQNDLLAYCKAKGIILTAYTATGYATVREDPTIVALAAKYKVSSAQIILAWHVSRGTAVVPKSANTERQKENIDLPTLSSEDIQSIDALDKGERLCIYYDLDAEGKLMGWTYEQLGW